MTVVVDKAVPHSKELTRIMWASQVKELIKSGSTVVEHGFYIFGGLDQDGGPTNDLYWVKPDLKTNLRCVSSKNGDLKGMTKAEIKFIAERVKPLGRPPL